MSQALQAACLYLHYSAMASLPARIIVSGAILCSMIAPFARISAEMCVADQCVGAIRVCRCSWLPELHDVRMHTLRHGFR